MKDIEELYHPCPDCSTKKLKKAIPLKRQIKLSKINKNYLKCETCGKRHMDIVMAHVLKVMIDENQISPSASIRHVGVPLITPAIFLDKLPYLSEKSLVIITTFCDNETAIKIIEEVPEIKAIIKGDTKITIGKLNENESVTNYELLGGCDIRCDIQYTDLGPILIYKNQSKVHIEYPKEKSPKIQQLSEVLDKYDNPTVLDAMCGPGTLGIYALMKNAKKVVFNDIYDEAVESLKINLEINQINENAYEILNENLLNLQDVLDEKFDIGIIDTFPDNDTSVYMEYLKELCDDIIII
ncbi:MAG TPA: methyltransferase [Methanosphaera sp.]|nr:methyltransferase [Methanosphaera sp.]HIJ15655.1 methyltransferase [Methanosphaera sp.]